MGHLAFYGGKGGVGKTTCAAARAVAAARSGHRVVVVSTDPAHSLGDALAVRLSSRPKTVPVARGRTLTAIELDAERAFARWLSENRAALGDALEHGTWLDRSDVEALLDLTLPGIDELAGMIEIARLSGGSPDVRRANDDRFSGRGAKARASRSTGASYDLVVVDTAPTGHALRLLAAPETVAAVADILDALQEEHRIVRDQLARVGRPEAADRLIGRLAEQAREMSATLRDPHRTSLHWVTLPEALSLAESEDAIAALTRSGIRVSEIIVNRVIPDDGPCAICARRRADERRVVSTIGRRLGRGRRVHTVAAELREPRGVAALARIADALTGVRRVRLQADLSRQARAGHDVQQEIGSARRAFAVSLPERARTFSPEQLSFLRDPTLLFFGGKGGVGKTTVAAAAAIRLARADPHRRTLLLSTDPAHSLGDVFNVRGGVVGDIARVLKGAPPTLWVRELDAAKALEARRRDLQEAIDAIATAFGADAVEQAVADTASRAGSSRAASGVVARSLGTAGIGRGAGRLMDLAPPGIDELFGVLSVLDARDHYDRIVVDTAPTGHALRLLEMPDAAREWVQALLRMLLKYQSVIHAGRLAEELVEASKSIRALQAMLRDPARTRFVVVSRAADVPRLETERLLDRLTRLGLAVPAVVVNALTLAPGGCPRCRAAAGAERKAIASLERWCGRRLRRCMIIRTPLAAPAPRGAQALNEWARLWGEDRE